MKYKLTEITLAEFLKLGISVDDLQIALNGEASKYFTADLIEKEVIKFDWQIGDKCIVDDCNHVITAIKESEMHPDFDVYITKCILTDDLIECSYDELTSRGL